MLDGEVRKHGTRPTRFQLRQTSVNILSAFRFVMKGRVEVFWEAELLFEGKVDFLREVEAKLVSVNEGR